MTNQTFGANWIHTNPTAKNFNPPTFLFKTYEAQVRRISFTYPFNWYEGINIWNELDGQPVNYEFGYVDPKYWQTGPNAPIGVWFFVGAVPIPSACNTKVKLTQIVSMEPVKIKGLNQTVYYVETLANPSYDAGKFIANGGLLAVHSPKPQVRFSLKDYLACHPLCDEWFVYDPASPQTALFQFSVRTFGLIQAEAGKTFSSKQAALAFFDSNYYGQAKQIMLSTTVTL
jgi:hypothetical protein